MLYLGDIKSPTYRQVSPSSAGTSPFVSSLFTFRPGAFLRPITLIISYLFQHVCKIRHLLPRPRCLRQRRPQRTYAPPAFDQFHPLISITATSLEAHHHGHGHHGSHNSRELGEGRMHPPAFNHFSCSCQLQLPTLTSATTPTDTTVATVREDSVRVRVHTARLRSFLLLTSVTATDLEARHHGHKHHEQRGFRDSIKQLFHPHTAPAPHAAPVA